MAISKQKQPIRQFRLIGGVLLVFTTFSFVYLATFINKPASDFNFLEKLISLTFWLGIVGSIIEYAYFHVKNKPFNSYGSQNAKPAFLVFVLTLINVVYHFMVSGNESWFQTASILTGAVVLGCLWFMIIVGFISLKHIRSNH